MAVQLVLLPSKRIISDLWRNDALPQVQQMAESLNRITLSPNRVAIWDVQGNIEIIATKK